MSSRAEYFLNLAAESTHLEYFNLFVTGLFFLIFLVSVLLLALRSPEKDQTLANLPLGD